MSQRSAESGSVAAFRDRRPRAEVDPLATFPRTLRAPTPDESRRGVVIAYATANFTVYRALVERLAPAERFRVETQFGPFELSRAEFERAFSSIVEFRDLLTLVDELEVAQSNVYELEAHTPRQRCGVSSAPTTASRTLPCDFTRPERRRRRHRRHNSPYRKYVDPSGPGSQLRRRDDGDDPSGAALEPFIDREQRNAARRRESDVFGVVGLRPA